MKTSAPKHETRNPPDEWFFRNVDGNVYGPADISELAVWAREGRITPDGCVSRDRVHWKNAPDLKELGMRFAVEVERGCWYGPFHEDVVRSLKAKGTLPPGAKVYALADGAGEVALLEDAGAKGALVPRVVEKVVEKIVEKRVEVPVVKEMRVEVPVEKTVVKEVRVEVPVEKIVEKRVEVPVVKEVRVEVPVVKEVRVEVPVEKVVVKEVRVEVPVEKVVERIVEKPVYVSESPRMADAHGENAASALAPDRRQSGVRGVFGGIFKGANHRDMAVLEAAARREIVAAKRRNAPFGLFARRKP